MSASKRFLESNFATPEQWAANERRKNRTCDKCRSEDSKDLGSQRKTIGFDHRFKCNNCGYEWIVWSAREEVING